MATQTVDEVSTDQATDEATTEATGSTGTTRHAVTINLSAEAFNFYKEAADADDRALAKFLARKLQKHYESESRMPGNQRNAGNLSPL